MTPAKIIDAPWGMLNLNFYNPEEFYMNDLKINKRGTNKMKFTAAQSKSIGKYIKELRTKKEWTLRDLSDFAGCSSTIITLIENNKYIISENIARKLAVAFKISLAKLTAGKLKK